MTLKVTKNGNVYEKSNVGKVSCGLGGAALGADYALRHHKGIETFCTDMQKRLADSVKNSAARKAKDVFTKGTKEAAERAGEEIAADAKVLKNANKYLNMLKNHPIKIFAAAGALAGIVTVGVAIDSIVNYNRAKRVDEVQKNKFINIDFFKKKS